MKTEEVIQIIHERGMRLYLDPQGRPTLTGVRRQLTPALLRVIVSEPHRSRIIEWIRQQDRGNTAA